MAGRALRSIWPFALIFSFALMGGCLPKARQAHSEGPELDEVGMYLRHLASAEVQQREAATRGLISMGSVVRARLQAFLPNGDPEVVARIHYILDEIDSSPDALTDTLARLVPSGDTGRQQFLWNAAYYIHRGLQDRPWGEVEEQLQQQGWKVARKVPHFGGEVSIIDHALATYVVVPPERVLRLEGETSFFVEFDVIRKVTPGRPTAFNVIRTFPVLRRSLRCTLIDLAGLDSFYRSIVDALLSAPELQGRFPTHQSVLVMDLMCGAFGRRNEGNNGHTIPREWGFYIRLKLDSDPFPWCICFIPLGPEQSAPFRDTHFHATRSFDFQPETIKVLVTHGYDTFLPSYAILSRADWVARHDDSVPRAFGAQDIDVLSRKATALSLVWDGAHSELQNDELEAIASLENLRHLRLSKRITNDQLDRIMQLPNIESLSFEWPEASEYEDAYASEWRTAPKRLSVRAPPFGSIDTKRISTISSLEALELANDDALSKEDLSYLARLPKLEELVLDSCENVGDEELIKVAELPGLKRLRVRRIHVSDHFLRVLALSARELRALTVDRCDKVTNLGLGHIAELRALQELSVARLDSLNDDGVRRLKALAKLRKLEIEGVPMGDAALDTLATLKGLEEVYLRGLDRITGRGIVKLSALPHLMHVEISACSGIERASIDALLKRLPGDWVLVKEPEEIVLW